MSLESMRRRYSQWKKETTGKAPLHGEFFEEYIKYMYGSLLAKNAGPVSIDRNVRVTDRIGAEYQFDILYQFQVAGLTHRVAIECKDTKRKVERDEAIAFVGKLQHMSSTIGIFLSRSGFQPAAAQYLDQHGIERLAETDLPDFGQIIASMIQTIALPDEHVIGQPFWSLMEATKGVLSGSWLVIPTASFGESSGLPSTEETVFPLFISQKNADLFRKTRFLSQYEFVVRGIEQPTLRMIIAMRTNSRFALATPSSADGKAPWWLEILSAQEMADHYLASWSGQP